LSLQEGNVPRINSALWTSARTGLATFDNLTKGYLKIRGNAVAKSQRTILLDLRGRLVETIVCLR
jgi:hypothetical protein